MKYAFERRTLLAGLSLLLSGMVSPAIAGAVVSGNPSLSVSQLNAQQVSDFFLGRASKLPDGSAVLFVVLLVGVFFLVVFYKNVVGKSPSQLKSYWAKIVFTGEGAPPKSLSGDQAIKHHVATTPGAIGYVDDKVVDGSIKVLLKP